MLNDVVCQETVLSPPRQLALSQAGLSQTLVSESLGRMERSGPHQPLLPRGRCGWKREDGAASDEQHCTDVRCLAI